MDSNICHKQSPQAQPEIRHRHGKRELRGKRAVFRNGRMAVPPYEVEQDAGSNPVCPAINKKIYNYGSIYINQDERST